MRSSDWESVSVECACAACDHDVQAKSHTDVAFCELCEHCDEEPLCIEERAIRAAWDEACPTCGEDECGYVCTVCGEQTATTERRWEQGHGMMNVRERCGDCIERDVLTRRAKRAASLAHHLRESLADETDVFIAESVAMRGRELALISGKPGDYPQHIATRLRLLGVSA